MKTAEEWYQERKQDVNQGRQSPLPSREFYAKIQIDAYKAGLLEAAMIANKGNYADFDINCAFHIREAILTALYDYGKTRR